MKTPKVVMLAAGEGSRLRPYTNNRPKCLVEVDGVSILQRQLSVLKKANINEIVLIGGYKSQMLEGMATRLYKNPRYDKTNMVYTLFCAESELHSDALLCYGDIVYSSKALNAILKSEADISVVIDLDWATYWQARSENPLDDAETLKLNEKGHIIEIGQKPKTMAEIEGQYIGLMKFTTEGLRILRNEYKEAQKIGFIRGKDIERAYMTDLLQLLIDKGHTLVSVPIHGGWLEVDTVADLENSITIQRAQEIASE